jgi:alkanesulfonate monooxygenase SsuD/methylene tetrahydromethanopterin reductase-like flavin-dependent oxidoreductase (luciferase family)
MRFGWLTLSLSPSPEEDADRIDQQIEQVRFAERLGFGDVWLTQHYFTGESVYNDAAVRLGCRDAYREDPDRLLPSCSYPSTTRCGSPSSLRCSTI